MILAAGRGDRMRPLTDTVPKPLLPVAGRPLIDYLLEALAQGGFREVVINHAHLGNRVVAHVGDGARFGLSVGYSHEKGGGLETGGGIVQALPMLGADAFVVVNGDIFTDFPFGRIARMPERLAHLVLVPNPVHHPQGDFVLGEGEFGPLQPATTDDEPRLTFSGIAVYRAEFFRGCRPGKFPLAPLLHAAIARGDVTGERFTGRWFDIGTPERLADVDALLR